MKPTPISPTWEMFSRLLAIILIGGPLTYVLFYGDRIWEGYWREGYAQQVIPDSILFVYSTVVGLLLTLGLRHTRLLKIAGPLAAGLAVGHVAWSFAATDVSLAFGASNMAEFLAALALTYTTAEAELERSHAEGR